MAIEPKKADKKAEPDTAQDDAAATKAQDDTARPWSRDDYLLADDNLTKLLPTCFWEAVGMHAYSKHDIQMARLISVAYENGFFGDGPFSLEHTDAGLKRYKELVEALDSTETGLSLIIQIAEDKWGVMEGKMLRSIEAAEDAAKFRDMAVGDSSGNAAKSEEPAEADKEDTDTDK